MELDATARRRWFGGLVLAAAIVLLVCGQTFLQGKLTGIAFMAYWLVCFILTATAIVVAFFDLRALQERTREEHRDLLQNTLDKIERDAKSKGPKSGGRAPKR